MWTGAAAARRFAAPLLLAAGLAAGWSLGRRTPGGAAPAAGGTAADAEARAAAEAEKEMLDLSGRVARLTRSLADAEARADRAPGGEGLPDESPAEGRAVLGYDGRLGLTVLAGGAGSGIRRGDVLDVFRDGAWVARVRATDVRAEVTGARVEEIRPGWAPRAGDRAVAGEQRRR